MKFIPLALSIVLFSAVIGVYAFLINSVTAGVDEASVFVQKSETLTKRDAVSRSMQAFLNDTSTEREELSKYVFSGSDVVSAIELIEQTAKDEKVSISISNVGVSGQDGWNYHEGIQVTFSASGTFSRMTSFISMLENLPVASKLNGTNLEVSGDGDWFGTFSIIFVKEK